MSEEYLYQFTGRELVREFSFNRMAEYPRLSLTIEGREGAARLVLVNPYPTNDLFALIDAEELWISEDAGDAGSGCIRVDFWVEEFLHFSADGVIDLDQKGYETDPGSESDYLTGPVKRR